MFASCPHHSSVLPLRTDGRASITTMVPSGNTCGRAAYFSDMYKSCDDSDSSDDEAEMRRIAKQLTRKIPRRSRQTANAGAGPRSSVVARVSGSSGDYSSEDEYSTPTVQADADYGGRTVQSSKESDSATEMKSDSVAETNWSVALTSGAMDSLIQALQDDIGKTVCSFESKRENNLRQPANACASHRYGNANGPSCTSPENSKHLPLYPPAVKKFNAHPRRFDVLFGLHKTLREHTGNVHADNLVASYRPKYDKADKPEKTAIASHIIKIIRESYDGRFMKFEGNEGWVEVEPGVAREKIIHSFRKSRAHTIRNHRTETSTEGIEMQKLLSQLLHLSPTTGGVVPTSVASASTFPEFLCQLTKMLSDSNREVIEWSHGKKEVHNPHKLQTHVLYRYFGYSKFASFQRQLNHFGFRKPRKKWKMAPCSYVHDATTNELGSLLFIKRKN